MTIDEICAEVAADTRGYVGPTYSVQGGTITLAARAPALRLDDIKQAGRDGRTWTEHGRLYGVCAGCGLMRPTENMKSVDGRWYCYDEAPKEK